MIAVIIPTLDPDSEMVARCVEQCPGAIVVHDHNRSGFAHTCNAGAASTTADLLVFLNDDTIPQPGWLDALVSASESHAIVGARLSYPDGTLQHTGVLLRRTPQGLLEAYNRREEADSGPVPAVTGACLAITREAWDLLGGFDESFVNGYEDVDLCLRAQTQGLSVFYAAESNVTHLESQSEGRFDHVAHNVDLLQRRWGWIPTEAR